MEQATKFYLPFFKTGYPNGKLYTYISNTDTLAPAYKDTLGTLHNNPIVLDDKGQCVLYIDSDITYRYILKDENDVTIYDENNIKQLNGEPGEPGGAQGEQGKQGKRGVQGISGNQGPIGLDGSVGDKGLPYLTKINIFNNQTIRIPQGVSEVYVTSSAGGGGAASWSPYIFMMKTNNNDAQPFSINPPAYIGNNEELVYSNNPLTFNRSKFATIVFMPGSGMSGQAVYKKKILLDKTKENTIQIFLGAGGTNSTVNLNGTDGGVTQIFVNGTKEIELKGGLGGQNFFPKDEKSIPALPADGTPIKLNRGQQSGMFYCTHKISNLIGGDSFTTPDQGKAIKIWPTSYRKVFNNTFIDNNVKLSYFSPLITMEPDQIAFNIYPTTSTNCLMGGQNIFGNLYSYHQRISQQGFDMRTSVKYGNELSGWGAGGDVFFDFYVPLPPNAQFTEFGSLLPSRMAGFYPQKVAIFDELALKSSIINYMSRFSVADSYSAGVKKLPTASDNSGVWQGLTNIKDLIADNPSTYLNYKGSGFYQGNGIVIPLPTGYAEARGGDGVSGFALIEYGNILEHFPDNMATASAVVTTEI